MKKRNPLYVAITIAIILTLVTVAVILLVLSILALLIQLICEVFGFVCRRYVEELIDTAVKDSAFLIGMIETIQNGADACKNAKEAISTA